MNLGPIEHIIAQRVGLLAIGSFILTYMYTRSMTSLKFKEICLIMQAPFICACRLIPVCVQGNIHKFAPLSGFGNQHLPSKPTDLMVCVFPGGTQKISANHKKTEREKGPCLLFGAILFTASCDRVCRTDKALCS